MKKIYINGEYITLENNKCEAILIENEFISKVGTKEEILKYADKDTEVIDLDGKTMMPAFIDAHSHFFGVANNFLQISLEECSNISEIQKKLYEYKMKNNIPEEKWIIANNYDQNVLEEKKHITKEQIDKVIRNNPVVISHKSGHAGIFNTKALEKLGIIAKTKDKDFLKRKYKRRKKQYNRITRRKFIYRKYKKSSNAKFRRTSRSM